MMRILAGRQGVLAAILIFLAPTVSGCAIDVTSHASINVERPAGSAAIPLRIGVYFSPEFLAFENRPPTGGNQPETIIRFGQNSADLFDGVFSTAFEDIRFVEARPPLAAGGSPVAAVIEPRIERADVRGRVGTYTVEILYHLRLYDRAGNLLLSWNSSGKAKSNPEGRLVYDGGAQPVQNDALRQAGENLMRTLYSDPKIAEWLRTQGVDLANR